MENKIYLTHKIKKESSVIIDEVELPIVNITFRLVNEMSPCTVYIERYRHKRRSLIRKSDGTKDHIIKPAGYSPENPNKETGRFKSKFIKNNKFDVIINPKDYFRVKTGQVLPIGGRSSSKPEFIFRFKLIKDEDIYYTDSYRLSISSDGVRLRQLL